MILKNITIFLVFSVALILSGLLCKAILLNLQLLEFFGLNPLAQLTDITTKEAIKLTMLVLCTFIGSVLCVFGLIAKMLNISPE